jgi:hypothetical protein
MEEKEMLPDWVSKHKEPLTEIKLIKGHYYKYSVKYKYDPERKRSVRAETILLGKITQDKGFIPSEKQSMREKLENPKVDTKLYGVYAVFSALMIEEEHALVEIFWERNCSCSIGFCNDALGVSKSDQTSFSLSLSRFLFRILVFKLCPH